MSKQHPLHEEPEQLPTLLVFGDEYDRRPVDLNHAAAELGLSSPDPLRAVLLAKDELTKRLELSPLLEGKAVSRELWNRADVGVCPAGELATELRVGIRRLIR